MPATVSRVFDPGHILDDGYLTGYHSFDVQAFLERIDSPLASLELANTPVSAILESVARETPIDVRVLLAKLQVEQSLLTSEPTPQKLDWALGYGLTDEDVFEEYRGFENQVKMAAWSLVGYLDKDNPYSVVGQVGLPWNVRDGLVVPENAATAALYRYTPWISGNELFYQVWLDLFGSDPRQPPEPTAEELAWRLIAPPDNWRSPLEVSEKDLAFIGELAERLGLVTTRDESRRKLYLGLPRRLPVAPPPSPPPAGPAVTYPSGVTVSVVTLTDPLEKSRYMAVADTAARLIAADPDLQLSPHFTLGEFLPNDPSYRYARLSPRLVELLETLRAELGGKPLVVTSGYRPPAYNQAVGGVPNSAHVDGLAADVYSPAVPIDTLWSLADRLVGDRGGVGYYRGQGFVHVDLRGYRARWTE